MVTRAAILFLTWLGATALQAQSTLPHPVLNTIYPCAAQIGSTAEVTITGTDLDAATKLHFSVKGIEVKAGAKPNQFTITVSKDAPTGYCDVRVIGRYGISNPRGFAITKLPVVEAKEATLKASVGQVIVGLSPKQDKRLITFEAKKGDAIQLLCDPVEIDSRMDAVVNVRDAKGLVEARLQGDEPMEFKASSDGVHTIEVNDLMYRGDAEYPFVLALSKPGASGLEPSMPLHPTEKLDADVSKPMPIEGTYTGWFPARGKPRYFTFAAKKGDVRIIEVKSARLGLNADPFFTVDKLDGEKTTFIAEANDRTALAAKDEFDAGWADPSYRFEAKEDGTYRIKLRNLFPTRAPFELSVQPPGVGFELVAIPNDIVPTKKTAATILAAPLWRGGVATFKITAMRERGFTGPIELSAEGCPPGMTCLGGLIGEGRDVGFVSFTADAKAEPWGGAVRIVGKHGDLSKTARGATVVRATADMTKAAVSTRFTKDTALDIVALDAPVLIEPAQPLYEVNAKGKFSVPLKVTRHADFADAIKLTALGLVTATPPTADVKAKGADGKFEGDVAKLKLTPGDYSVVLQTTAKLKLKSDDPKAKPKDVVATVHSKPFTIRVTPEAKVDAKPAAKPAVKPAAKKEAKK